MLGGNNWTLFIHTEIQVSHISDDALFCCFKLSEQDFSPESCLRIVSGINGATWKGRQSAGCILDFYLDKCTQQLIRRWCDIQLSWSKQKSSNFGCRPVVPRLHLTCTWWWWGNYAEMKHDNTNTIQQFTEKEDTVEIIVHGSWYKQARFDTIKAQTNDEMVLIKELFDNNIQ